MIHVAEKNYFPDFSQYMRSMTNVSETQSIGEIWDIQSTEEWQEIRMMRNRFAHDYPDDWSKNSALVNVACEAAADMYRILIEVTNLKLGI